jgi:hypothetical protein
VIEGTGAFNIAYGRWHREEEEEEEEEEEVEEEVISVWLLYTYISMLITAS